MTEPTQTSPRGLDPAAILERLRARFGERVRGDGAHAGAVWAVFDREDVLEALRFLRDDPELAFDRLADVTAVDHLYLEVPEIRERFAVVYQLHSLSRGHTFRIKAAVPEDAPRLPSACGLWKAALWGERETHDMFGIEFEGNPDMRRLLMPSNYNGFPLRKDYPLRGRGEREDYPQVRRSF